jgi:hypothetical protein
MDDFRGGKFIVGSDMRGDEQRRMANEYFRNQNESQRMASEGGRNDAASNALGIANTHSKNNFLTQVGMFTAVVLAVVILAVIAILAYQKATDNQSLVDLDNIRDLTLSNLTVTDTATVKGVTTLQDELNSSAGADFAGGLSVTGNLDLGGNVVLDGGVSLLGGLSVGGVTNLYGDLISIGGISTTGGLSVGGVTNLYGDLISIGGISTTGGLSVGGLANFYSGVSITGGLSVSETAIIGTGQIKKDSVILTSAVTGISTGYQLTTNDAGITYIIENKDSGGLSISTSFKLPQQVENGSKYHFLWGDNDSANIMNFKLHTYDQNDKLFGTVMTARQGSSVITLSQNNSTAVHNGTGVPVLFHYDGTLYPGSRLDCTYIESNWVLDGYLGTSSDYTSNNGFIGTTNPTWIAAGLSTNTSNAEEIVISYDGSHFYEANTISGIEFYDIKYGISSEGTSIWVGAAKHMSSYTGVSMRYSTDGICWKAGRGAGADMVGRSVSYSLYTGTGGTSLWTATGYNPTGTTNLIYSTDGVSWENSTGASFQSSGFGITYGLSSDGTSLWAAVGQQNDGVNSNLLYSTDGISWQYSTGVSFGSTGRGLAITYGLSSFSTGTCMWVAVGQQKDSINSNILYSTNGSVWLNSSGLSFAGGEGQTVAYGLSDNGTSSIWVAGGNGSSDRLLYSNNGSVWQSSTGETFPGKKVYSVAFGKNGSDERWVALAGSVDSKNNFSYSDDGKSWVYSTTGDIFSYGGGRVIVYNKPLYPNHDNPVDN